MCITAFPRSSETRSAVSSSQTPGWKSPEENCLDTMEVPTGVTIMDAGGGAQGRAWKVTSGILASLAPTWRLVQNGLPPRLQWPSHHCCQGPVICFMEYTGTIPSGKIFPLTFCVASPLSALPLGPCRGCPRGQLRTGLAVLVWSQAVGGKFHFILFLYSRNRSRCIFINISKL